MPPRSNNTNVQQPVNNTYSYPQSPMPPSPPPKKHNGAVIALAIVAALAVVGSMVFLALGMLNSDETPDETSSSVEMSDVKNDEVNNDAPSLEITDWDDNDGGLSYKEVVNRNYDSTVVIVTYTKSNSYNFGESDLVEAGGASGIIMSEDGYIITNWHCVINEDTGKPFDRES